MKNYAGHRLSPWLGHLMVSRSETARQLLTPGEIMQLPPADEIVMVAGLAPIRAKKARYYEDHRFVDRILPPPEPDQSGKESADDWSTLSLPAEPVINEMPSPAENEDGKPTESEHRRQPELSRTTTVERKSPIENEFELDLVDDADDEAARNRRMIRLMHGVARQISLDPADGMEL